MRELALDLRGEVAHRNDDVTVEADEIVELTVVDLNPVAALGTDLLDLGLEQHAGANASTADNQCLDHAKHLSVASVVVAKAVIPAYLTT